MDGEELKLGIEHDIKELIGKLSSACRSEVLEEKSYQALTFDEAVSGYRRKFGVDVRQATTGTGIEILRGMWESEGKLYITPKQVITKGEKIVTEPQHKAVVCPGMDTEDLRRLKILLELKKLL